MDLRRRRPVAVAVPPEVKAVVPEAELYKYSTTLHSMTHGRGTYRQAFHGYAEAPPDIAAKVAAEHKKEEEKE